jgi:hypothetical protein
MMVRMPTVDVLDREALACDQSLHTAFHVLYSLTNTHNTVDIDIAP